jgi:hypothetical protein
VREGVTTNDKPMSTAQGIWHVAKFLIWVGLAIFFAWLIYTSIVSQQEREEQQIIADEEYERGMAAIDAREKRSSANKEHKIHASCDLLFPCNNWSRRTSFWSGARCFFCKEGLWW